MARSTITRSLRKELDQLELPPQWRGHADTEILLSAFERWGIEAGLKKTVGMFALALWDRQERMLTLARDRVGEKPLYYGWQGDVCLVRLGTESLACAPGVSERHRPRSVGCLLSARLHRRASFDLSGHFQASAGYLPAVLGAGARGVVPRPRTYWSLREVAARGLAEPFAAVKRRRSASSIPRCCVRWRINASPTYRWVLFFRAGSIPVPSSLSCRRSPADPVKTFTIGFHEDGV